MGAENFKGLTAGETAEDVLLEIAERIQVSPSKHNDAVAHYNGLCEHVDRKDSPLHGLVNTCYPSGSFGIGAAVASNVQANQHDVDVVIELAVSPYAAPRSVLDSLYKAIKGDPGSAYYDKPVVRQSRCVTVTYPDGVTVDLMPVARLPGAQPLASHLFHHKDAEAFHKEVNPHAFKEHFNATVKEDPDFARKLANRGRVQLVEKAHVDEMPGHVPLARKSSRVVALQLLKRYRDVQYRAPNRKALRRPPSVALAALALGMGDPTGDIVAELWALADHIRGEIATARRGGNLLRVANPAHPIDVFTDRWPHQDHDQLLFSKDLEFLMARLEAWAGRSFGPEALSSEIRPVFGETVARYVVESYLEKRRGEADQGRLRFGTGGRVITGAAAATAPGFAARASTHYGGRCDDE